MSAEAGRRRTAKARATFLASLPDGEGRRAHFAELARRKTGRLELSADEAAALVAAFDVLRPAIERARRKLTAAGSPTGEEGSGDA